MLHLKEWTAPHWFPPQPAWAIPSEPRRCTEGEHSRSNVREYGAWILQSLDEHVGGRFYHYEPTIMLDEPLLTTDDQELDTPAQARAVARKLRTHADQLAAAADFLERVQAGLEDGEGR